MPIHDFPQSLQTLTFGISYYQPTKDLPPNLLHLRIPFFTLLQDEALPSRLRHLSVWRDDADLGLPVKQHVLPPTLALLEVHSHQYFDQIPPSLTYFIIRYGSTPISFPSTLTFLNIGNINVCITEYPQTLTHLIIGVFHHHPISNLPPALTHLVVGDWKLNFETSLFCESAEREFVLHGNLPASLTHLIFGVVTNPNNLNSLFGVNYNFVRLPFNYPLPPSIKYFGGQTNHLATNINKYEGSFLACQFTCRLAGRPVFALPATPDPVTCFLVLSNLTHLHLKLEGFTLLPYRLPPTLTHLLLHGISSKSFFSTLPDLVNLTHLVVYSMGAENTIILPPSVTHLYLFQAILSVQPNKCPALTHLFIRGSTKLPLPDLPNLERLTTDDVEKTGLNYLPPHVDVRGLPYDQFLVCVKKEF